MYSLVCSKQKLTELKFLLISPVTSETSSENPAVKGSYAK